MSGSTADRSNSTAAHHAAEVRSLGDGRFAVELDGVVRRYAVQADDDVIWVTRGGHQLEARTQRIEHAGAGLPAGSLEAPMPGTVLQVRVQDGDEVAEGDVLLVLESMKMELSILAPNDGVVSGLTLRPGDRVEHKQPLVAVTADGGEPSHE